MTHHRRSRWHIGLILLSAALIVAGATALVDLAQAGAPPATPAGTPQASPASSDNPYAEEFDRARRDATSDFERDVLADDRITPAEYEDAVQRYLVCVREKGVAIEARPDPFVPGAYTYVIEHAEGAADTLKAITTACADGTTMRIEALYTASIVNPENRDRDTLVLACLRARGLVDANFRLDDLQTLFDSVAGEGALPFNPYDEVFTVEEAVTACLVNPAQTGIAATPIASPAPHS